MSVSRQIINCFVCLSVNVNVYIYDVTVQFYLFIFFILLLLLLIITYIMCNILFAASAFTTG